MATPRGRLSQQSEGTAPTVQVVSGAQTANFSARGGARYIIEAPTAGLIVLLPPPSPSGRNEEIQFMHRNTNPVRYQCLNGQVNKTAQVTVSSVGLLLTLTDGQSGWFTVSSGGGGGIAGVNLTENGGASLGSMTTLNVNDSAEINVAASFLSGVGSLIWNIIAASVALSKLANAPADTVVGNITGAPAAHVDVPLSSLAGTGLTYNAGTHKFDVSASGGLTQDQILNLITFRA